MGDSGKSRTKKSGSALGEETYQAILRWVQEHDAAGDYHDYENGGKISRKLIMDETGVSRPPLNQNKKIKELLLETEKRWFGESISVSKSKKSLEAATERAERQSSKMKSENSNLIDELARVKAENSALRAELKKYKAMKEVIQETGFVRL